MSKKRTKQVDAVGWIFWLVVFIVLIPAGFYGAHKITREDVSHLVSFGIGVLAAAIAAGFVSWAVNAVIQFFRERERKAQRKRARKGR